MANPVFQAIVTTLDRSSPALATIKRNIEGLGGAAMRAQVSTQRLAMVPIGRMRGAVAGLSGAFSRLRGHIGGVWSGLTSLMPPLAALGAGGSLAGVFGLVRHVADAREEMLHMAETIGVAPRALARLNFVAQMTGTNVEGMQTAMTKLNRVMGDASRGKNKSALELFQRMGVTMEELRTGNAATILPKIAGAFRATESDTLKAAMAVALFGRAGQSLKIMLQQTPEQLRTWIAQLDRLGYKFTEVDDKNLTKFRQSWIGLETAVGGFTNQLGAGLSRVLEPIVAQFRDWIAVNRPWITGEITEGVRSFTAWIGQQDWSGLLRDARTAVRIAGDLIDKLGGVRRVVELIVGFKLASWALAAAGGFDVLTASVKRFALVQLPAWFGLFARLAPLLLTGPAGQVTGDSEPQDKQIEENRKRHEEYRREHPEYQEPWERLRQHLPLWLGGPTPQSAPQNLIPGPLPGRAAPPAEFMPWPRMPIPGQQPGGIGPLQILPNLYMPSAAPALQGQQGAVDVRVSFDNAPPGTRVETRGTGQVRVPPPEVGYAFGFERLGFA